MNNNQSITWKSITWKILTALTIGTFLIAFVIVTATMAACYWSEPNSPMPAWIQAIGSIVAILTSFTVLAWDHKKQRDAAKYVENSELANLVLATHNLGLRISGVLSTFRGSDGLTGTVSLSALDFCINQIKRIIEQNSHIPHWKMDLKAASTWQEACKLATNIEGALLLAKSRSQDSEMAYAVDLAEAHPQWQRSLGKLDSKTKARYKELTKEEIPEFIE